MAHIPNSLRLIEIANMSETAQTLMTDLGARERHRAFSDIKRQKAELIRKDYKIVDADANMFWRMLEQEGFGSIVFSAVNNKPDKFYWNFSLKEIAAIALEEKKPSEDVVAVDPVAAGRAAAAKVEAAKTIAKVADKPVPNVVKLAKERQAKSESEKISAMSTRPFDAALAKVQRASAQISSQPLVPSHGEKVVAVPIRDGSVDIEIKMPADATKEEVEMAVRVLMRRLA